jgi:hypothetical protein
MSQPIYFLPGVRDTQFANVAQARAVLAERGLTDVFADVPLEKMPHFEPPGRGPGDKAGTLVTYQTVAGDIPPRWGFYPDEQEWSEVNDELWLGIDTARPPVPDDLKRRKQYGGYSLELGDGNQWTVPVVRRPDGSSELPTSMSWDATGAYTEPIKAAYRGIWERVQPVASWLYRESDEAILRSEALRICIDVLALNYRFSAAEQRVLSLIDSETYLLILAAAVDLPRASEIVSAEKKMNEPQAA